MAIDYSRSSEDPYPYPVPEPDEITKEEQYGGAPKQPPPPLELPAWASDEAFKTWFLLQSQDNIWPDDPTGWTRPLLDAAEKAYAAYQQTAGGGGKGTAATGQVTPDAILAWLRANGSLTAGLEPLRAAFEAYFPGAQVISADKIRLPNGQIIDAIVNYGGADPSWGWQVDTGQGSSAGTGTGVNADYQAWLDSLPNNFYEAPGEEFNYPDFAPPEWNGPTFTAPDPFAHSAFEGPTAETFTADPGYEFRAKEGRRALENAASAQGTLRTGGTLKGLIDWSQGLASQEFGNVWNRAYTGWQANRGAAAEDYDRLWNNLLQDYMVGYNQEADEYNRALGTWNANLGKAATQYGFGLDVAAGKAGGQQGAASLKGNLGLANQGQQFGNQLSLYDIATRNLPTYSPTPYSPSYGYTPGS